MSVRKLVLLVLLAAACSHNPPPGVALPGAAAPRLAVTAFLDAVAAQDLQAMSRVWGTAEGPARDQLDRNELDKRLIVMQGCFAHDSYSVLSDTPGVDGQHSVRVSLVRGNRTKTVNFVTYKGPSDRYYMGVLDRDFPAIQDFCS
jgi:hypothetical protein